MTNTHITEEVLKTDTLGRVRTSRARREEIVDEFEKSGLSGQAFAALAGIKYQTFATWVQKRRRAGGKGEVESLGEESKFGALSSPSRVPWIEVWSSSRCRAPVKWSICWFGCLAERACRLQIKSNEGEPKMRTGKG